PRRAERAGDRAPRGFAAARGDRDQLDSRSRREAHRQADGALGRQPDRRDDPAHSHRHQRLARLPAVVARYSGYQLSAPSAGLILVKHALPEIVPGKPPTSWLLSREGRASCTPLAERLSAYQPNIIVT